VGLLHQHHPASNPLGASFNYAEAFRTLDYGALEADLRALMTDSPDWWPADLGHHGGYVHPHGLAQRRHLSAGGRTRWILAMGTNALLPSTAGQITPIWIRPDGCSGPSSSAMAPHISWADLIVLTGNVALESMGFQTLGFAAGRKDIWQPEEDVVLG